MVCFNPIRFSITNHIRIDIDIKMHSIDWQRMKQNQLFLYFEPLNYLYSIECK